MHILSLLEKRQHKTEEGKYLDQSHFGDGNARTWPGLLVPQASFLNHFVILCEYGSKTHPVPALVEPSF